MARIDYDDRTAAAFRSAREVPLEGLREWRAAVRRHLDPAPGMTLLDLGAGTGAFATAFTEWFGVEVVAVEPSASMRAQIPRSQGIRVFGGDATALPLPDGSADACWLSTVIHHIPDLAAAAHEIRRVLRPGAPVLIRQAFPGGSDRLELGRWFPEIARTIDSYPTVEQTCQAFAAAGFRRDALEEVPQTQMAGLDALFKRADVMREADTTMRHLSESEFQAGKERLRQAVRRSADPTRPEPRVSWLNLLVLR